jgi:translation elongation factor P/translation initiation factor 5A
MREALEGQYDNSKRFQNGVTFEWDGKVMQVVEFRHVSR